MILALLSDVNIKYIYRREPLYVLHAAASVDLYVVPCPSSTQNICNIYIIHTKLAYICKSNLTFTWVHLSASLHLKAPCYVCNCLCFHICTPVRYHFRLWTVESWKHHWKWIKCECACEYLNLPFNLHFLPKLANMICPAIWVPGFLNTLKKGVAVHLRHIRHALGSEEEQVLY